MMLLREGSSWGTKACEEMGRVFMTAYLKALPSSTPDTTLPGPYEPMPQWVKEELKDGDRICEAAGVQRTEGGRLPVQKIVNKLKAAPVSAIEPTARQVEIDGLIQNLAHGANDEYMKTIGLEGARSRLIYLQNWAENIVSRSDGGSAP